VRDVSDKEFEAVFALDGGERYNHFVRHVADTEEVWSLRSEQGWVLTSDDDGIEFVPVWPHPRYAEACAVGYWKDAQPTSISLELWIEKWTPGMIKDSRQVAVFPTPSGEGFVITPQALRDDLLEECSQYE